MRQRTRGSYDGGWAPSVPVAERRATGAKTMANRAKKGLKVDPIPAFRTRSIATTFWGRTWCVALESQADFANRLDRGKTYVRNGSVLHLEIQPGVVSAVVQGSAVYDVRVTVKPLAPPKWAALRGACAGHVASALEILQGKLSSAVMSVMTRPGDGMVPVKGDLGLSCSCPDGAAMCKHVAAVLYGVGVRLDREPELLFTLRGVSMSELVTVATGALTRTPTSKRAIAGTNDDLSAMFGIDLAEAPAKTAAVKVVKTAEGKAKAAPVKAKAAPVKATKTKATRAKG